jgi:hypothetical protein
MVAEAAQSQATMVVSPIAFLIGFGALAALAWLLHVSLGRLFHTSTPFVREFLIITPVLSGLEAVALMMGSTALSHGVLHIAVGFPVLLYLYVRVVILAARRSD